MALELVGHAYGSSDDDDRDHASEDNLVEPPPTTVLTRHVELAPTVIGVANGVTRGLQASEDNSIIMKWNAPASTARAPVEGPVHPYRRSRADGASHSGGRAERAAIEDWSFHEQYHNFHSYGYAEDAAGGSNLVGSAEDLARAQAEGAATVSLRAPKRARTWKRREDIGDETVHGIWAPEPEEDEAIGVNEAISEERRAEIADAVQSEQAKNRRGYDVNEDHDRRDERKLGHILPPRHDRDTVAIEASSEFHGESELDYQGRSWMAPAPGSSRRSGGDHDCFIPKKCIHRFTGHSKGIQTVRLFPSTGHLALSGSMDSTCKIWDVYNDRRLLRTYSGHAEAVRDVAFSNDGKTFASTGFDRFVRIWDTETGHCLYTLTPNRKMSYCVDFYPRDAAIILAGASDNRIYQWDLRAPAKDDDRASSSTAQIVQEYNYHLQPVNSVTFIDDDQRFVSTGDDKKIFVWEYNIPVPMKYVSEPHMNAVPIVELHPSAQFWCGQSLDNKVVTYQARDKMKQLHKKNFKGHLCSGYSCGLTFSPNGRYLASGDAEGRTVIWDFKTTRLLRKWHCHDSACLDVAWHPVEPSWLITCGWDCLIKLWD